jgi:hypothetical protein
MSSKRAIKQEAGRHTEMADADTVIAGLHAQRQSVDSGSTVVVPAGYGVSLPGPFTINGTLQLDGDMVVI